MTAREVDSNGWVEISDNPISKAGVFPYTGIQCDPNGTLGLDPDAVYNVYRAAAELSNSETVDSFKLIPWVDNHTILGNDSLELTPAEEKGVGGVIGERVYFENNTLFGNLKMFSGDLESKVDGGKKELSCGFRCKYSVKSGMFGDQHYDLVQTHIRGNHLASVDAGRMGPDVAVLDHQLTFSCDAKDFQTMEEDKDKTAEDEMEEKEESKAEDTYNDKDEKSGMDEDDKDESKGEDNEDADRDLGMDDDDDDKADAKGEDAAAVVALDAELKDLRKEFRSHKRNGMKSIMRELRKRDTLYSQASQFVGAFDHADMTAEDIAVYACDKLGLKTKPAHALISVEAYFHNRTPAPVLSSAAIAGVGMDSKLDSSAINAYFGGAK